MASQCKDLNLDNIDECEVWMTIFEATARSKKIKDTEKEFGLTDLFISLAGITAVKKISIMCKPAMLHELKYVKIKEIILTNLKPKKKVTMLERAHFMQLAQKSNENVINYLQRLREKAQTCDFEKLNSTLSIQSAEDDLIQMRLINGLACQYQKQKLLEVIQTGTSEMTLSKCVDYIQQLELIETSSLTPHSESKPITEVSNINQNEENHVPEIHVNYQSHRKMIKNCKFCGRNHAVRNCPAYGKRCTRCARLHHFASQCRMIQNVELIDCSDKEKYENVERPKEVWSIHFDSMNINQIEMKMEKISIDGKLVPMQIDTGADITVISTHVWKEVLKSPKLEKYSKRLEVYDGHRLTTRGKLVTAIERNGKFLLGDIIVVESRKPFGLLGRNF